MRSEHSPLDQPMYTAAMAARFTSLRASRVRRWLRGYGYRYPVASQHVTRVSHQGPVIKRTTDQPYATFLDLVDLLFVRSFLQHGITLQRLRKALKEAEELLGGHHFAQRAFFTDGHQIWLQVHKNSDALMQLLSGGQWVIARIIKELAEQIDFQELSGFAERWYPLGPRTPVVLDPRIAFGAPTIVGRGVETSNVYDLYLAERKKTRLVVRWMELEEQEVEAAVRFESGLRAA